MTRYSGTLELEAYTRELVGWHLECLDTFRRGVRVGTPGVAPDLLNLLHASRKALETVRPFDPTVNNYLHLRKGMADNEGGPTYMVWATAVEGAEERLRELIRA